MRFSDLCDKEVINVEDCRCIGTVRDIDFNPDCGTICAVIIPGPGKYLGWLCRDYDFWIPWNRIVKIGPDIVLVHLDEHEMCRKR